jgi:hypothetical protein
MPYIKQEDRVELDDGQIPADAGELAYALSQILDDYLISNGRVNYARHAEVVGVLETLKLEFYRRFTGPYEDDKRESNGDAFYFVVK